MKLSKAARQALARLADGKQANASVRALGELVAHGLATPQGVITVLGRERATQARSRAVAHYRRTRHVGGLALPKRWQRGD